MSLGNYDVLELGVALSLQIWYCIFKTYLREQYYIYVPIII